MKSIGVREKRFSMVFRVDSYLSGWKIHVDIRDKAKKAVSCCSGLAYEEEGGVSMEDVR